MADDKYDEVDAVVRIPKGERLADSHKTEGWSRGFTPKSTDKGPEHVEIRLKDRTASHPVESPEVVHVTHYVGDSRPAEPTWAQEVVADFVNQVINGVIEAVKPHMTYWWDTQAIPAMRTKRDGFAQRRRARKAGKAPQATASTTELISANAVEDEVSSSQDAAVAVDDPKLSMTSEQFQQLFMTWLAREEAQQVLLYAIAHAQVEDDDAATLAWREGLNELSPEKRTERITEVLAGNPSILENLRRILLERGPAELSEPIPRRNES